MSWFTPKQRQMQVQILRGTRWFCIGGLWACLAMLTGCASGFYANVTSYQKWPADAAGQTYRIVPQADQAADNLEFQAVADMVRANIGSTGLVEATHAAGTDQAARFDVHLQYDNPATRIWEQGYADYSPWFAPYGGYYGRHFGWGGNLFYAPQLIMVPVQVHRNTLTLWMTDSQHNHAEVYRATAIQLGQSDQLIASMPYLAQAIFDGFPGNNGQVRQIRYPLPDGSLND